MHLDRPVLGRMADDRGARGRRRGSERECGEKDLDAHQVSSTRTAGRKVRVPPSADNLPDRRDVRSLRLHDAVGGDRPPPAQRDPGIQWRDSRALGTPSAGRLVRGVRFPAAGSRFFTWDPLLHRRPDRPGRRWGTDLLVRKVPHVVSGYAASHPSAPRLGIGDLSRRLGGPFGPRHASHQNGLDVDVYYPRRDRRERPPRVPPRSTTGLPRISSTASSRRAPSSSSSARTRG